MRFFKKEKKLYPSIEPFDWGFIKKGIHEIYYEQCGNPKGKPAVFLHGGPGGGAGKLSRRFFNPKKYRIILFDQRGCGKSKPHTCLEDNTTWHLIEDIESIESVKSYLNSRPKLIDVGVEPKLVIDGVAHPTGVKKT